MTSEALEGFRKTHGSLIEALYRRAQAVRWGLTVERFAEALWRSAAQRFREAVGSSSEVAAYLESLRVEDLALACACSDANEPAWEHFMQQYRSELYAAARAIVGSGECPGGNESRARELADSLYAELYLGGARCEVETGTAGQQPARRRSLFDYFHGRSKLSTWLRAVLAQRHVDCIRESRRTQYLDEKEEKGAGAYGQRPWPQASSRPGESDPDRARYVRLLQAALLEAIAALEPRARLRLSCYYVQELTLAQIGKLLGEHEATASRHLERARRQIRKQVERALREGRVAVDGATRAERLSDAQIRLCFQYATDEWHFDLTQALSTAPETDGPAGLTEPRSAREKE